jgi:hypothetical protein
VQHLAAAGAGSQQRMVAQPVGVALGGWCFSWVRKLAG